MCLIIRKTHRKVKILNDTKLVKKNVLDIIKVLEDEGVLSKLK